MTLQPIILYSDNTSMLISASNTFIQTHSLSSFKVKVLHDFIDWMQYRKQACTSLQTQTVQLTLPLRLGTVLG